MLRTLVAALAGARPARRRPALAATTQAPPKDVHWSFEGPFGHFDQEQLQRGYKVYREVCSACHSMNLMAFRNLGEPGGPFYNPKYPNPNDNPVVKALAKDFQVPDIDSDTGDAIKRPGTSADYFPAVRQRSGRRAASNGGALPPDLSLIAKAREGGPAYIYSILTGDGTTPPHGLTVPAGKYYDPYIAGDLSSLLARRSARRCRKGGFIAMPPPLTANKVTFDDGTRRRVEPGGQGRRRLPGLGRRAEDGGAQAARAWR